MKKKQFHFATLILLLVFVLLKIPYLDLPYFWDEAWVYGPAIQTMAESGPSLSPGAISSELGRGHPLLFHFIGSLWIKLFGSSLFSTHCFALSVSVAFLSFLYFILTRLVNEITAFSCVILVMCQSVFFTQSALVLPEVMLAFFSIAALIFYLEKKTGLYFLYSVMAVLTKESAIVIFLSLSVYALLFNEEKKWKILLTDLFRINTPVFVWLVFLLWQKNIYGWWLFPEHTGSLTFDFPLVINKFENYFSYLFIYQGRNILSLVLLISVSLNLFRRNALTSVEKYIIRISILFTVLFLLFSSINFYSNRYILSLVVLHCMVTSLLLFRLNIIYYIKGILFVAVIFSGSWNIHNGRAVNDHNRGYADAVICTKKTVDYLLSDPVIRKEKIYTTFLTSVALKDHRTGYIKSGDEIVNVSNTDPVNATLIILNNFENDVHFSFENPDKDHLHLFFECSSGKASVKIFRKKQD